MKVEEVGENYIHEHLKGFHCGKKREKGVVE